jgi:hypothetical protein
MTAFEYVAVLVSIIVGLSLTHLLGGVGRLIGTPRRAVTYWVHLVWSAYAFIYLISFWWWEFQLSAVEVWTIQLYLFLILYSTLLYLVCVVLYPRDQPGDFREYFFLRRKWFFGIWISVYLVDIADSAMKGRDHLASLGMEYWVMSAVFIVLCVTAIASQSKRFHGALAVAMVAYAVYQFSWTPWLVSAMP